jgi:hypothetical protein
MQTAFDIFVRLPDGHPLWIEAVQNLEQARKCMKKVARNAMGDCFHDENIGVAAKRIPILKCSGSEQGIPDFLQGTFTSKAVAIVFFVLLPAFSDGPGMRNLRSEANVEEIQ